MKRTYLKQKLDVLLTVAAIAAGLAFAPIKTPAAPGGLDLTFGHAGISYDRVSGYSMMPIAIARKPNDGTIVVAGLVQPQGSTPKLLLRHYSANGILDTNFGSSGFGVAPSGPLLYHLIDGWASDVLVQNDGKILVAGYFTTYSNNVYTTHLYVWRFNSNGILDTGFGNSGSVIVSGTNPNVHLTFSNGKILALSETHLTRLNLDGSFDYSFGWFGTVTIPPLDSNDLFYGTAIAIDLNGDILIGGEVQIASDQQPWLPVIIRYTSSGSPVTTYGTYQSGWAYGLAFGSLPCSDNGENAHTNPYTSLAVQPDGNVVAGGAGYGTPLVALLERHRSGNGSLDSGFGTGGVALGCNGDGEGKSVGLQSTGKIALLTADKLIGTYSNGSLEFIANEPYTTYEYQDMFVQPADDKFVVLSNSLNLTDPTNEVILARYMP